MDEAAGRSPSQQRELPPGCSPSQYTSAVHVERYTPPITIVQQRDLPPGCSPSQHTAAGSTALQQRDLLVHVELLGRLDLQPLQPHCTNETLGQLPGGATLEHKAWGRGRVGNEGVESGESQLEGEDGGSYQGCHP